MIKRCGCRLYRRGSNKRVLWTHVELVLWFSHRSVQSQEHRSLKKAVQGDRAAQSLQEIARPQIPARCSQVTTAKRFSQRGWMGSRPLGNPSTVFSQDELSASSLLSSAKTPGRHPKRDGKPRLDGRPLDSRRMNSVFCMGCQGLPV